MLQDQSVERYREEKLKQMLEYNVTLTDLQKVADQTEYKKEMSKVSGVKTMLQVHLKLFDIYQIIFRGQKQILRIE